MTVSHQDSLDAVVAALRSAQRIVTAGHIGPDGDALGSALGLALAAREVGKDADATFGEPFVVPDPFRFLDLEALTKPGDIEGPIDVFVACDTAAVERLGSAASLAERATTIVVVDHHLSNGGFGDLGYVDSGAAATAQMIFHLIEALEWPITPAIATALYTGIVTDTGRFQYSSTSPETHRITARLLEAGVAPEIVGQHIYEEAPFGYLVVAGAVLGRAVLDTERRFVWSVMHTADLKAGGVSYPDTDGLIDILRIASETDVACLLKEVGGGVYKGSLRSRGRVDVAAIAAQFGGGGHHNAAGFTHRGTPEDAVARVQAALP